MWIEDDSQLHSVGTHQGQMLVVATAPDCATDYETARGPLVDLERLVLGTSAFVARVEGRAFDGVIFDPHGPRGPWVKPWSIIAAMEHDLSWA